MSTVEAHIGVFLSYAVPSGRTFLDRELYLSKAWIDDAAPCKPAGIPDEREMATTPVPAASRPWATSHVPGRHRGQPQGPHLHGATGNDDPALVADDALVAEAIEEEHFGRIIRNDVDDELPQEAFAGVTEEVVSAS